MLGKWLFRIAKSPLMGTLVGKAFQYCSWLIPVRRAFSSREVLAFYHPQPSYENHIILTPKKAVRSLQQMADDRFCGFFPCIWQAVQSLHASNPAFDDSYVLIANGGKKQEVQQVHFHLFTNHRLVNDGHFEGLEKAVCRTGALAVWEHPKPEWEHHFVCMPAAGDFQSVLRSIQTLDDQFHIAQKGYSLLFQYDKQQSDLNAPVFHIISGKRKT